MKYGSLLKFTGNILVIIWGKGTGHILSPILYLGKPIEKED